MVALQKYKSCKWESSRLSISEGEACYVVVKALWDLHAKANPDSPQELTLRPGGGLVRNLNHAS